MQEILLSQKQYQALLTRLDDINNDVLLIKFKTGQESTFIDGYELAKLMNVTYRTLSRWRKSGRLPFLRLGRRVYYRVDVLLDSCKIHSDVDDECGTIQPLIPVQIDENQEMKCKWCPLFLLLTM
jgi:excisionase family DNA binding protein